MLFTAIRKSAIILLGISIAALATIGILSIWEVIEKDDVFRSLTSMGIISFSAFLVIVVAMEREGKLMNYFLNERKGQDPASIGWGRVVTVLLVVFVIWTFLRMLFFRFP